MPVSLGLLTHTQCTGDAKACGGHLVVVERFTWAVESSSRESVNYFSKMIRAPGGSRVRALDLVLLQFSVERSFPDAQHSSRGLLVASGLPQRTQDCPPFEFVERQQFFFFGGALGGRILQSGWKVCRADERHAAQSNRPLNGVFQFPDVSRPVISHQPAHGVFGKLASHFVLP